MTAWILRLGRHDERVLHALVRRRRSPMDRVMGAVTHLGGAAVTVPLAAMLSLGAVTGLEGAGRVAAFALVASHGLVQLLKRTIARPRPRLPLGIDALSRAPDRFSFPSGHSAAALSLALPLAGALPPGLGVAALGLAGVIGLSRCYLGVHYPGDVVVGWILAALATLLAEPALALWPVLG